MARIVTLNAKLKVRNGKHVKGAITWGDHDISNSTRTHIRRRLRGIGLESSDVGSDKIEYELCGAEGEQMDGDLRKFLRLPGGKRHKLTPELAAQAQALITSLVKEILKDQKSFGSATIRVSQSVER